MALPVQPEILIAHPWMGRGGSEATAMWSLHALQDLAKITFTTASPLDWDTLNAIYGTRVSPEKVTFVQAPRIPGVSSATKLAYWQRAYFERFCVSIGSRYDACISAYNPIRFGQAAIQLIGDFSFSEECRLELYPNAAKQVKHRPSLLRHLYLSVGEQLAGRVDGAIAGPRDLVVANSRWTAQVLEKRFPLRDTPILYPPAGLNDPGPARQRDPLGFVCMGRIMPEKEVETVIRILDGVRAAGHGATLDLAGHFGADAYSKRIRALADERSEWIRLTGFLGPEEKADLFATRSFGLHGCRVEAFGIGVAEMAAAGLIPFVPADGGVGEIVGLEELIYQHADGAVKKIIAQITQPANHEALRAVLREKVARFLPAHFAENLTAIVQDFLGRPLAAN